MGRGLGDLQLSILGLLQSRPPGRDFRQRWSVAELTQRIHGDGFTDTDRRGVARAVSALAKRGLVNASLSAKTRRPAEVRRYGHTERWEVPIPETLVGLPCTCGFFTQ